MSVRRSSRTNKGIHSKRLDTEFGQDDEPRKKIMTEQPSKRKSTLRQPKYVPIKGECVRCLVCGTTDLNYNEEDDDAIHGMMIQCDSCHTWQHVRCMFGKNLKESELPKNYKCDVCDPEAYRSGNFRRKLSYERYLLTRLGDSWKDNTIDDNKTDENEEDDEILQDSGALNDDDDVDYTDSKKKSKVQSDDELSDDEEGKNGSKKKVFKKNIQSPEIEHNSNSKSKSKSNSKSQPQSTSSSSSTSAYDTIRSRIVKNLELKLVALLPKTNNEDLLKGKTVGELAKEWAAILENGIHELYPNYQVDHSKYTEKARSLLTNLKISKLVDRVISGEFTIEQLPKLTTEEMRTAEEKRKAKEVRLQALNQVVIKNEVSNLPKTRLTHRGEEIIGDTDFQFDINDKRNSEVEKIKEKQRKLEHIEPEVGEKIRDGSENGRYFFNTEDAQEDVNPSFLNSGAPTVNNHYGNEEEGGDDDDYYYYNDKNEGETINHDILDDDDFDNILNDGMSKEKKEIPNSKSTSSLNEELKSKANHEKKDKVESHEPKPMAEIEKHYSKTDMWEGTLGSPELSFNCKIDFVSSTCNKSPEWNVIDLAYRIINEGAVGKNGYFNKGRLRCNVADDYLDKIKHTRDLYLFEVHANIDENKDDNKVAFTKMWSYYHSASRYAVLSNELPYIKDSYLLALSREKIVDGEEGSLIMQSFPSDEIMDHLDESLADSKLYIIFVVQKNIDSIKPLDLSRYQQTKKEKNNHQQIKENELVSKNGRKGAIDDDYDPALSVTLSKLTGGGNNEGGQNVGAPDLALANLMKNLG